MKKRFILVVSVLFFLSSPLCGTELGTFFAGAKFWYTFWDSGALKWYGDQLASIYDNWGVPTTVETKTGTGYLAGPLFGYQTPNGKWNISFAPMIISNSSQKQTITVSNTAYTVETDIDLERQDYDLAVSYSLSDLKKVSPFFEYCKLFAGFKYQTTKLDLQVIEYTNGVPEDNPRLSSIDYSASMPTVGFGVAYPVTNKIVLGVQGGIGMVFIDEKETVIHGYEYRLDPENSISYNAEVGLNIVPMTRVIAQIGYRYQQWKFSPKIEQGVSTSGKDVTQGPSLTLVYTF